MVCLAMFKLSELLVDVSGVHSDPWSDDVGVGQGKCLSADLFNLGSLSNALWTVLSDLILYADDGGDIISGASDFELNKIVPLGLIWLASL